jgi:hypothetical protein
MSGASILRVFGAVADERIRQDRKWGEQNHPSVDEELAGCCRPETMCEHYGIPDEQTAKRKCDEAAKFELCTWAHIAVEELSEAVSAETDTLRRAELVQLAAVVVAWIECIDRRTA